MRLIALCALNLCSAKTVQPVLLDRQSARLPCPKIQVPGDIFSIEWRARKGADPVSKCTGVCSIVLERGIKQIGSEDVLGGGEQLFGQRSLTPAYHLGIEPRCLHRIR